MTLKNLVFAFRLVEKMRAAYGRDVAVLPLQEVASIIASAGFDTPVLFFQNLLTPLLSL